MKEQAAFTSAKKGEARFTAQNSAGYVVITVLRMILANLASAVCAVLLFLIPIIGWVFSLLVGVLTLVGNVVTIISLLIYCFTNVTITTLGIYGRDDYGAAFDVSFEQIARVKPEGKKVTISANVTKKNGVCKKKDIILHMVNVEEFVQAYENR